MAKKSMAKLYHSKIDPSPQNKSQIKNLKFEDLPRGVLAEGMLALRRILNS